jgi:predicted nucleic acid-binding protein
MNVVDSCGWLEYFANGKNADFFAPIVESPDTVLVPHMVVYEVSRRLRLVYGEAGEETGMTFLKQCQLVDTSYELIRNAVKLAETHKLAMADAIILQTAITHHALLFTQDAAFKGLANVAFTPK